MQANNNIIANTIIRYRSMLHKRNMPLSNYMDVTVIAIIVTRHTRITKNAYHVIVELTSVEAGMV